MFTCPQCVQISQYTSQSNDCFFLVHTSFEIDLKSSWRNILAGKSSLSTPLLDKIRCLFLLLGFCEGAAERLITPAKLVLTVL